MKTCQGKERRRLFGEKRIRTKQEKRETWGGIKSLNHAPEFSEGKKRGNGCSDIEGNSSHGSGEGKGRMGGHHHALQSSDPRSSGLGNLFCNDQSNRLSTTTTMMKGCVGKKKRKRVGDCAASTRRACDTKASGRIPK